MKPAKTLNTDSPQRPLKNTILHHDTHDLSQTVRQIERTAGNGRILLPRASREEDKDGSHRDAAAEIGYIDVEGFYEGKRRADREG